MFFNTFAPVMIRGLQLSPILGAGEKWDPNTPPSLVAARAKLFAAKRAERNDRERQAVDRKLEQFNRKRIALNRDRKSAGTTTTNINTPHMRGNSLDEAKATLRRLRDSANSLLRLQSGSLTEAQSILDRIYEKDAECSRIARRTEVTRCQNILSRMGLPISR